MQPEGRIEEFESWAAERGLDFSYFVYRFHANDGTLLYVGITNNLRNRLYAHYTDKPWISEVRKIAYETVISEEAARARETELILTQVPIYNISQNGRIAEVVSYLRRVYEEKGCAEVMKTMDMIVEAEG